MDQCPVEVLTWRACGSRRPIISMVRRPCRSRVASAVTGYRLSLQFVGKHLGEPLLCRIGHAYEQATEWHTLRPPV